VHRYGDIEVGAADEMTVIIALAPNHAIRHADTPDFSEREGAPAC
jgi:hypothetical protein